MYAVKPNKIEAEIISSIKIKDMNDIEKVCDYFIDIGVKEVFISLAEDGICYASDGIFDIIKQKPKTIVNTNGAGDSMMAGLLYGELAGYSIEDKAKLATAIANNTSK